MSDCSLRKLERNYLSDQTDENWERLTRERERLYLLDAFAMVNGHGFFIPNWVETREEIQPYISFKVGPDDLIDIHYGGLVRQLPYGTTN